MQSRISFVVALFMLAALPAARAHGIWVAVRCDQPCVVLGEGAKDNAYDPSMVTEVKGYTSDHREARVEVLPRENHARLGLAKDVAIVAVKFDYGYWSKGADGKFVHKPMNEVPGATMGTYALKLNVSYQDPEVAPMPVEGHELQIVPSVNPAGLNMGDTFVVQLLHRGKPMADTPIIVDVINDLNGTVTTDADGKATITVRNNALNVLGVETAVQEAGNEQYTQKKYFASLSFTCQPEYD